MPRFTDIIDAAQAAQERLNSDAQAEVQARAAPQTDPLFDGKHCIEPDCGVTIPMARRKLGRIRCVVCQEILEKKGKQA